jgi:uncharacterized membrane protein
MQLRVANTPKRFPMEFVVLGILFAINLISVFGFVVFTLNPSTLSRWPWAPGIYTVSYLFFSQAQIVTAFLAMVIALFKYARGQWLVSFVCLTVLSAASELLGTTYGIPFGPYAYTHLLGPKLFGHVPYLIPLSWFFMALPSFWLAHQVLRLPNPRSMVLRVLLASLLLLSWDLTLDPAMSFLTPFWVWGEPGYYYGMPLSNLVGWFVTGLVLMSVLEVLDAIRWLQNLPGGFLSLFYLINLFLPFSMAVFAGLFGAVLVTVAVGVLYFALLFFNRHAAVRPASFQSSVKL